TVVDRLRGELELLAHQVEPARERRDRERDEVALDPRNRGLGGARAGGELALRQAVATSGRAEELSRGHARADISSHIKTGTVRRRWRGAANGRASPRA